jgi:hypothetical protein
MFTGNVEQPAAIREKEVMMRSHQRHCRGHSDATSAVCRREGTRSARSVRETGVCGNGLAPRLDPMQHDGDATQTIFLTSYITRRSRTSVLATGRSVPKKRGWSVGGRALSGGDAPTRNAWPACPFVPAVVRIERRLDH